MIIYATKQTIERYGLPDDLHPEGNVVPLFAAREAGNPLQEWGAKLFYFDRRKCLQVCNFASKFTLFLFDLKKKDVNLIGELIGFYIYELYSDDEEMKPAIVELFGLKPASVLLERIRVEKEQLVKEGKIKKEKHPSRIFRGSDNLS